MLLTIWRHGQAGAAARDRDRELTPVGEDDIGFGAVQFQTACTVRGMVEPELILHSPWLRTTQTAEIIDCAIAHSALQPCAALAPGSTTADVNGTLTPFTGDQAEHLLLVSHQPLVSQLIDSYLGTSGMVPALSPGGLATLELSVPEAGCGSLKFWALPPEYEAAL